MKSSIKELLGRELRDLVLSDNWVENIANWAHNILISPQFLPNDVENIITDLAHMEAGPEFVLSKVDLNILANKLIKEGEEETLSKPIGSIRDSAEELQGSWLMCPLCQEAWQAESRLGMVRCPACHSILHNPKYFPCQ